MNTQDRREIETLTTTVTKEGAAVAELNKLKDSLEGELEEHETMVDELTEQVGVYCVGHVICADDQSEFRDRGSGHVVYWMIHHSESAV